MWGCIIYNLKKLINFSLSKNGAYYTRTRKKRKSEPKQNSLQEIDKSVTGLKLTV